MKQSLKDLHNSRVAIRVLEKILRRDYRDLTKDFRKAGIEADDEGWPLVEAIHAVLDSIKERASAQSSTDRRNIAQARKAEVETAAIERKLVPVAEVTEVCSRFLRAIQAAIQESAITNDEREKLVTQIHRICDAQEPDWLADFSAPTE